jgi:hypoxanthine phosphoribosyltransferase
VDETTTATLAADSPPRPRSDCRKPLNGFDPSCLYYRPVRRLEVGQRRRRTAIIWTMADRNYQIKPLISRDAIETRLDEMAREIHRDYAAKNPVVIVVLKGAFIFAADLVRRLEFPLQLEFVRLASYGDGTETSGQVCLETDLPDGLGGRHLLVLEDIVDSGLTLTYLIQRLEACGPASVKLAALLDKPSRRRVPLEVSYIGFEAPDKFVIGCGLDYAERYRNLPEICYLEAADDAV